TAGRDVKRPPTVELFGSLLGTERDASELLDELALRVGADPRTDFRSHMSPQETARYWAAPGAADRSEQDERQQSLEPEHLFLQPEFFRPPMPRPAITAFLANLAEERTPGHSRELDFPPWGGAYNRIRDDATAFAHRGELFSLKHTAIVDSGSPQAARDAAQ